MFEFRLEATSGQARAGTLTLPHGPVRTPAFMPVGTNGAVRGLDPDEVRRAGAQIVLGNTYHLHLRPGEAVVRALGGLSRFTGWHGPMLTDSGGFQVFSLEGFRTIDEHGVEFTSHVDGTLRTITPESAMEIQWTLGADIAMAFDHVVPGQAPYALAREGMERTLRWLDRCRRRHRELADPSCQTLWPIVQGGTHDDLRLRSLEGTLARGPWTGIAIGGLSVGEPKEVMHRVLETLAPVVPREVPRYLMGVGFPPDLLEGIARGVDLFDCVAATRNGRHGSAWLGTGKINIRGAAYRTSDEPLDPECDCATCTRFSRGYLRHLFVAGEMLGLRLVALHNVRFLVRLAEAARAAILDGTFDRWSREWLRRYHAGGAS
ncbi:MAG TPA: tRNA guanosine(34) transglycosylase Tgt [Gemmatimonadales bacterium]|nr:tRNA guanosine(34) transglycosylase Tgt [Gemmatimonadales bacterium]